MSTSSPRPSSSVHWSGSATRQTGSPERATPTVAGTDVLLGAQVGKYRILRQLGQGGMGRVYEAEDAVLKRRVALKVLLETATDNEQATRRFLHEAQSIARLNHPNIVAIHEADERDGICFLVMELVQGQSAEARLRHDGPFPWREATRIMMAVCQGLAAAHAAGLIHRDIKPGNIMLAGEAVKLGDFGLAKAVEPVEPGAPALTGPGIVVGTPDYMSPEQCRSEPFDERTDLYSLGAAYYALLTGKTPFRGETSFQVMMAHCSHPPPDPRHCNPDIPVGCAAIVQRALAKQPAERYQHAVEMQLALEGLLHGPGGAALSKAKTHRTAPLQPRRAPRRRWPAALGALAVLGLAVLMLRPYWNRPAPAFPPPTSSAQANAASAVANTADFAAFDPAAIGEGGLVLPLGTAVSALAIAPNGKHLAVAAGEPTGGVRVWDWTTGQPRWLLWKGQPIRALDFSADGAELAVATRNGIRVWDCVRQLGTVLEAGAEVRAVAYAPARKQLATGQGANAKLFDTQTGATIRAFGELPAAVNSVAFSHEGLLLAAGDEAGNIRVWNTLTGKVIEEFTLGQRINRLVFTPEPIPIAEQLAAASADRLHYWRALTWKKQTVWPQHALTPTVDIKAVAFSPDGRLVVSAGWNGDRDAVLFNRERFGFNNRYGHRDGITAFGFSPDSRIMASGSQDGTVRLWDVRRFHEHGLPQGK